MPALSFRLKLVLAMMLVVVGVTGAALLVTQQNVEATYRKLFQDRFEREVEFFSTLRESRLAAVKGTCLDLARSVRLIAAIEEDDTALLYRIALDELRDILRPGLDAPLARRATFFRLMGARGDVLPPPDERAGLDGAAGLEADVARVSRALASDAAQEVGYLAPAVGERAELQEVIVTRIVDPVEQRALGTLVVGFPVQDFGEPRTDDAAAIQSGIWLAGQLYSRSVADDLRATLATHGEALARAGAVSGERIVQAAGDSWRVFYRAINPTKHFPPAYQVGVLSMAEALARRRGLRRQVLGLGALALLVGLALSVVIARGLTQPIRELVDGTGDIQRGNLAVRVPVRSRDEIGGLAAAFNEMAVGLALKERYRSVLDLVSDRDVAEQLMRGEVALGGEQREASVLFCDICGFTALSAAMEPHAVVAILNEHMTALTRVVHEEHGVVDKFVGDALMAIFGAPRSHGNDAQHAIRAACRMIEARAALNARSRPPIEMRIGIATGTVVAGCMGSVDRLNYTVVGERVNLAARLCAQADPMGVLIDETTHRHLGDLVQVEAVPDLQLKGFADPVSAYRVVALATARTA
jgi:class 3 adenylate cyclase